MALLAVAALSARLLADAAVHDGYEVLALDLFGDRDTRRIARRWQPVGDPATLALHRDALLAGLRQAAADGAIGWVAGSGFEARPELLADGYRLLPLLGTAPADQRRLRDPLAFFSFLAAHGVAHPPVASQPPADGIGWLVKNARGCGGGHVRQAVPGEGPLPPFHYAQRQWPGQAMSATFVANGRSAVVLGFNRQQVQPLGRSPYVFGGAVGPVAVPSAAARSVQRALRLLVAEHAIVGLGSLDFLLDGEQAWVLEVNARPPATLALYADHAPLAAHVAACRQGLLPDLPELPDPLAPPPAAALATQSGATSGTGSDKAPAAPVRGFACVFAQRAGQVGPDLASALAGLDGTHDLPHAGDPVAQHGPLCTVAAQAGSEAAVRTLLQDRQAQVRHLAQQLF